MNIDEGTDDFLDEKGRTIRWERVFDQAENEKNERKCCKPGERILTGKEAMDDVEGEATLNQLNEDLYERLESRRRAISNWKRLKIVIVILKMSNGRMQEPEEGKGDNTFVEPPTTIDDTFARLIILPNSKYLILWTILMTLIYLLAIF